MSNLQLIKDNRQRKMDEIIEYLKQDNGYWFENDKWDLTEKHFIGEKVYNRRYINFSCIKNDNLRNEVKYFFVNKFKEKLLTNYGLGRLNSPLKYFSDFYWGNSIFDLDREKTYQRWKLFLINKGIKLNTNEKSYFWFTNYLIDFFKDFYDEREETKKDIWYSKNIRGAKIPASGSNNCKNNQINFGNIPNYYRDTVKRYMVTIITRKSWSHCQEILIVLNYFFNKFYSKAYSGGFLKELSREDIEKYIYWINNDYKNKNNHYRSKFLTYVRIFLDYIQLAQYAEAPNVEVSFLIFKDDTPKRDIMTIQVKSAKFIPDPIIKQLDNNIMDLDRSQYIPIYILLRETGWRGTDILNLRYNNCLEQIWNNKEQKYNHYLCGEITKTEISQLKIPVGDKVAEMVQKAVNEARRLSTEENNPKKYLFNIYEGKLKGRPYSKATITGSIERLIKQKDIRDCNGEIYHFKMHSLRHTRAKEYVEQGMSISIIQQILGHTSLQMTVHYATVTENTLYEKWKQTEDLDLFRVNPSTHEIQQVDINSEDGENLVRYEYVKKNLDAVRVPFGVCFKPSKTLCKQQMNHCLTCASFCTTVENVPEFEEEIEKVKKQIEISDRCGRELWAEKNRIYLKLLEELLERVKQQKIVHKNGASREDVING